MDKKNIAIGCSVAAIIGLGLVGVVIFKASKGISSVVREQKAKYEERANWSAPEPGTKGNALFPQTAGSYSRDGAVESVAGMPDFEIELAGEKSSYGNIDVYAWEVTDPEPLFDDVLEFIDDEAGYNFRSNLRIPGTFKFSVGPPRINGRFYANKGWLFFFVSNQADGDQLAEFEASFVDEFAHATSE